MWERLSVCLCVGVCVCVCLSVDSGALMLKDVSSFFSLHWAPLAVGVGLLWCHACVTAEHSAQKRQRGAIKMACLFSPHLHPLPTYVPLSSCRSFFYGATYAGKYFIVIMPPPRTSSPRWNPGRYFMMGKKLRFYWGELNAAFTLKGAKILSERNLILCVFLNSAHPACPYLIDTVCCSCYPPFLIVRGWIDPDITCHILRTREYL